MLTTQTYPTLCDGVTRVPSPNAGVSWSFTVSNLLSPVVTTSYWTRTTDISNITFSEPRPTCAIGVKDCNGLAEAYQISQEDAYSTWAAENIVTLSLASPPTSIVVNGAPTPLSGPSPVLTIRGDVYSPLHRPDLKYSISNGKNLHTEPTLTPGGTNTLTYDLDYIYSFVPGPNCRFDRPVDPIPCEEKKCTIHGSSIDLWYFAPPETSRDICSNTSPVYDRNTVSLFQQPHASTVINGSTYWSDKAYLSYTAISAYKQCSGSIIQVGSKYPGRIVEVPSSAVSSICGWSLTRVLAHEMLVGGTAYPFNYADLVGPVPNSAYQCKSTVSSR